MTTGKTRADEAWSLLRYDWPSVSYQKSLNQLRSAIDASIAAALEAHEQARHKPDVVVIPPAMPIRFGDEQAVACTNCRDQFLDMTFFSQHLPCPRPADAGPAPGSRGVCGTCGGTGFQCNAGTRGCSVWACKSGRRPCPDCTPAPAAEGAPERIRILPCHSVSGMVLGSGHWLESPMGHRFVSEDVHERVVATERNAAHVRGWQEGLERAPNVDRERIQKAESERDTARARIEALEGERGRLEVDLKAMTEKCDARGRLMAGMRNQLNAVIEAAGGEVP